MNKTLVMLVALPLLACGTRLTPRQRYVQALNHRLAGDAHTYFDEMLALAHDEPDSRAGRRARATIQSGGVMTDVAVVGVLAAIAIPNFLKFQSASKQAEAKTNLRALYVAEQSHYAESDSYCSTFAACGWQPESGSRYLYLLGSQEVAGGDAAESYPLLRMRVSAVLTELDIDARVSKKGFLLVAVGNIDSDGDLDVWTIDQDGNLENVKNDLD